MTAAGAPASDPYAVASPRTAAGVFFSYPLEAGNRQGTANKIVWILAEPVYEPLNVVARPTEAIVPQLEWTVDPSGQYPSTLNVQAAGCWRFNLREASRA